jgi:hypothetical protein
MISFTFRPWIGHRGGEKPLTMSSIESLSSSGIQSLYWCHVSLLRNICLWTACRNCLLLALLVICDCKNFVVGCGTTKCTRGRKESLQSLDPNPRYKQRMPHIVVTCFRLLLRSEGIQLLRIATLSLLLVQLQYILIGDRLSWLWQFISE